MDMRTSESTSLGTPMLASSPAGGCAMDNVVEEDDWPAPLRFALSGGGWPDAFPATSGHRCNFMTSIQKGSIHQLLEF